MLLTVTLYAVAELGGPRGHFADIDTPIGHGQSVWGPRATTRY